MTLKTSSLQKGLVLHLPLDKESLQSATVFADKTPYENAGTSANVAGFVPDRMGQVDRAMSFNGIDDYVDCGNDESLLLGDGSKGTLSFWVKSNIPWANQTNYTGLVQKGHSSGWLTGSYHITKWLTNLKFRITNSDTNTDSSMNIAFPSANEFHLFTMTWDGSNMFGYIDGIEEATTPQMVNATHRSGEGIWISQSGLSNFFNGSIVDVRIYNRGLSPEEVTALYEQYRPKMVTSSLQKGLVLHLPLDKESLQSATVFADKTPYENAGTSANVAGFVPDRMGQVDRAMSFNGIDDYVDCGVVPEITNWKGTTMSCWIKPSALGGIQGIIGKYNSSPSKYQLYSNNNDLSFGIGVDTYTLSDVLTNEIYNHIVVKTSPSTMYVYLDGVEYSKNYVGDITPTAPYYIGKYHSGGLFFNGSIADVRIYNQALSSEEVAALYEQYRPKLLV